MKTDLAVIGQGVVCAAGVGMEALLHGRPSETRTPFVSCPDRDWPTFRVNLNDPLLQRWQKEPRLRRASPISYFLVEAAEQALAGLDVAERAQTGLVVAFSTGCLAYSRRFFESIITEGQKTASPMLFPETVFNSPISHVASVLRLEGAAYALCGDEAAWIGALKTAWLWLEQERVKQVLVLGAEEFESASLDAYQSAGWLKSHKAKPPFIPSEGAAAVLVRRAQLGDIKIISQLEEGFIYRSKTEAKAAAQRCFQYFDSSLPVFENPQRHWLGDMERELTRFRYQSGNEQTYLGEATTASIAWNNLRALVLLEQPQSRMLFPVLGKTHQVGALQIESKIN